MFLKMNTGAVIWLALVALATAYHLKEFPGPYCGKLTNAVKCCTGRLDDCSHEIKGTLCYCDEFCSRNGSKHDDCCPDYDTVCLGAPAQLEMTTLPPGNCRLGDLTRDNCNDCKCTLSNGYAADWECTSDVCIISEEVLDSGRLLRGWRMSNYTQLWGRKLADGLRLKLGTLQLSQRTLSMKPDPSYTRKIKLPSTFDARSRWPRFISPVYDQGWCGADWAISTAAVASDRFAIQSNGAESVQLSSQHLLCTQGGCKGGQVDSAWLYVRHKGLVPKDCFPYTEISKKRCPPADTTLSSAGCAPAENGRNERYRTSPVKRLGSVEDIMYEIYTSGPVQAVMTVRQDFFAYKGGVYRHSAAGEQSMAGSHAVRVLGWGEDGGDKYWLVANSWGPAWGEDGFFRIARGENESDIEKFVLSTLADVYEANVEPAK